MKGKKLGKGLDQLIQGSFGRAQAPATDAQETRKVIEQQIAQERTDAAGRVFEIPVDKIARNPYQPRDVFDPEGIKQLAQSIANLGLMQPVVVKEIPGGYQLIAGERRLRACKELGLATVPAIVKTADSRKMLELALIENIQRQDLNPVEKAQAITQLLEDFKLTHEQIAQQLGISRTAVSNLTRLLALAPEVLNDVASGALSEGHAKVLAGIPELARQIQLARQVKSLNLSVRALESLLEKQKTQGADAAAKPSPYVADMQEKLEQALGARVRIKAKNERGRIEIHFADTEQFEALFQKLTRES